MRQPFFMDVIYRRMRPNDIDQVAEIEQQSPSPWAKDLILSEVSKKISFQYVLAEKESEKVVAWCCINRVGEEAELLKIAVHRESRRSGFATILLDHLNKELKQQEVEKLFLEVRSKNQPACELYKKNHFEEIGRRKAYYRNPKDDALIFLLKILY